MYIPWLYASGDNFGLGKLNVRRSQSDKIFKGTEEVKERNNSMSQK
jgi:hypothetical protein